MPPITKDQLIEKRGDLSPFLIHLTRTGDFKQNKDLYSLPQDAVVQIKAKVSLQNIISTRRIEAKSAFGYFNYKVPLKRASGTILNQASLVQRDWLKAVCFTETPIDHVYLQMQEVLGRQLQCEPYGLAFHESVVRGKNGNPIFYAQTTNHSIRTAFDLLVTNPVASNFKSMMPLVEGFGPPWFTGYNSPREIDFRWEREWRVAGDFSFSLSEVAFGFCPTSEITSFENLTGNIFPFIDPDPTKLATNKQRIKAYKHLHYLK